MQIDLHYFTGVSKIDIASYHIGSAALNKKSVTTVEIPDVKAIRKALHMSQYRFAALSRIPLPTLKRWEQGRRAPDASAAAYLRAIQPRPKKIMEPSPVEETWIRLVLNSSMKTAPALVCGCPIIRGRNDPIGAPSCIACQRAKSER